MLTNTAAPDKLGGLERYVRDLAAKLVSLDHEVTVVCKRPGADFAPEEIGSDGVRLVRYNVPSKRSPLFAVNYPVAVNRAVARVLANQHQVVLHAHFPVPAVVPALRHTPYVYTLHAPVYRELLMERQGTYVLPKPLQRAAVTGLRAAEKMVVRRASAIVTLSDFMRSEVRILDHASVERVTVIGGGVDTDAFSPSANSIHPDGAGPLLFAARRHVPRTGVQELVESMPTILRALPAARLVLAGDGLQRSVIEAVVDRLDLRKQVKLLGRISEEQLIDWYRRADLVITPTQQLEGFGLATAEALACGTPVLVTPVGANPEVVGPLSERLVARGRTPAAIADAVVRLWGGNGAAVRDLRASARQTVHPAMSWSTIANRHVDLYSSLVESTAEASNGHASRRRR